MKKKEETYTGCFNDVFEELEKSTVFKQSNQNIAYENNFLSFNEELQLEYIRKDNFKKATFGQKLMFCFFKCFSQIFTMMILPLGLYLCNKIPIYFENDFNMKTHEDWFFLDIFCYLFSIFIVALIVTIIALLLGAI